MKETKTKPNRRQEIQRRWSNREREDALHDVYLGSCVDCGGDVFGTLDDIKCRDCGWNNTQTHQERKAA